MSKRLADLEEPKNPLGLQRESRPIQAGLDCFEERAAGQEPEKEGLDCFEKEWLAETQVERLEEEWAHLEEWLAEAEELQGAGFDGKR